MVVKRGWGSLTMNVLIVDDDQLCHEIVRAMLKEKGITAQSVYNVDSALDVLSAHQFDLIVTDVIMPGRHGTDLIQTLRGDGNTTPIIAMTAGHENALDDYVNHAGMFADMALPKPVNRQQFLDLVEKLAPVA